MSDNEKDDGFEDMNENENENQKDEKDMKADGEYRLELQGQDAADDDDGEVDGVELASDATDEEESFEEAMLREFGVQNQDGDAQAGLHDEEENKSQDLFDFEAADLEAEDNGGDQEGEAFGIEGSELAGFESAAIDDAEEASGEEFIPIEQLESILESMLFVSDKPLTLPAIKQVFKSTNVTTKQIKRALEELASEFASIHRGVTLEEVGGGYRLHTKVDNMNYLKRLVKARPFRLSGSAMEVMSIVAYKQPVVKAEIDEIRGVESGHLLRALMEKGLVNFAGKSDLPGKPMLYGTTRKFLEVFNLKSLKELPTLSEIDELIPEGIGDQAEDRVTLDVLTENLSQDAGQTYSEGENELLKITDQLASINTSSEFFEEEKRRQREKRDRERAQDIQDAIAMGDEVPEKDRRWLERYQAQQLASHNPDAPDALDVSDGGAEPPAGAVLATEGFGEVDEDVKQAQDSDSAVEVQDIGDGQADADRLAQAIAKFDSEDEDDVSEGSEAAHAADAADADDDGLSREEPVNDLLWSDSEKPSDL